MEKEKSLVNSLEKRIDETEMRFEETNKLSEERLKQTLEAESKIIQLKTDMQRLEEKLSDMETTDQVLRRQTLLNSPATKLSCRFASTTFEVNIPESQSATPAKKFGTESDEQLRRYNILVHRFVLELNLVRRLCRRRKVTLRFVYLALGAGDLLDGHRRETGCTLSFFVQVPKT